MGDKGLCDTCENDKGCILQSKFPIIQCEEFTAFNHGVRKAARQKIKKVKCLEEAATEE